MKGFGVGCFAFLALWALPTAGHYRVMTPAVPVELRPWLALASALLLALGLLSFWYLARGVGQGDASRAAVLRRAAAGEVPPGGGPVVASGVVRALGAPLSGAPCVGYQYKMYYMARSRGRSGRPMAVPVYWGHAARPFAIDSPATRFEEIEMGLLGVTGTTLQLANTLFSDDDGEARRDWTAAGDARDPQTLLLETLLPVGQVASVAGTWSPERNAIVAGGEGAVGPGVCVILGPPENLAGQKGGLPLPASFASYLITATLLTALGVGLVWFSIAVLPGLR